MLLLINYGLIQQVLRKHKFIAEFAQGRYCLMHLVRREKGGGLL